MVPVVPKLQQLPQIPWSFTRVTAPEMSVRRGGREEGMSCIIHAWVHARTLASSPGVKGEERERLVHTVCACA